MSAVPLWVFFGPKKDSKKSPATIPASFASRVSATTSPLQSATKSVSVDHLVRVIMNMPEPAATKMLAKLKETERCCIHGFRVRGFSTWQEQT
jgi:hypothetical protein